MATHPGIVRASPGPAPSPAAESGRRLGRRRWKIGRWISGLFGYRRLTTGSEREGGNSHFLGFLGLAGPLTCREKLAKLATWDRPWAGVLRVTEFRQPAVGGDFRAEIRRGGGGYRVRAVGIFDSDVKHLTRWRIPRTDGALMSDEREDDRDYSVVVNDEKQYSIWLLDRPVPAGWHREGKTGSRSDCLAYIEEAWTDMRPLSLRRRMQARDGAAT